MTVELAGAAWVLPLAFALQALSAVLIVLRLVKGPSGPDRVVAIDALTLVGAAAVALVSLASAQAVLLDVAVALALIAFLGTAAFALMFSAARQEAPGGATGEGAERVRWRRVEPAAGRTSRRETGAEDGR